MYLTFVTSEDPSSTNYSMMKKSFFCLIKCVCFPIFVIHFGGLKKLIWLRPPPPPTHLQCQPKSLDSLNETCSIFLFILPFLNPTSYTKIKWLLVSDSFAIFSSIVNANIFYRKAYYSPRRFWRSRACYCLETCSIWQSSTYLCCSWLVVHGHVQYGLILIIVL